MGRRGLAESFLALVDNRFRPDGLYLLHEPGAALSVTGNLALLRRMSELVADRSPLIVATQSPILTGCSRQPSTS
jgi:predicted ATPase